MVCSPVISEPTARNTGMRATAAPIAVPSRMEILKPTNARWSVRHAASVSVPNSS